MYIESRMFKIKTKNQKSPMDKDFTLLLLTQHHPVSQQFQILSYRDVASISTDVAGFLQTTEQQASKCVLDSIYAYASAAVYGNRS